jgi:SP family myo-inositol transporter-like MFS transporter 13
VSDPRFNTLLYYSGTLFGLFGFSNGAAAGLIPAGINALFVVSAYTFLPLIRE